MIIYFPEQDKFLSNTLELSDIPCKNFVVTDKVENHFHIALFDNFISISDGEISLSKNEKILFTIVRDNVLDLFDHRLKIENNRLMISEYQEDLPILLCENSDHFYNRIKLNIVIENKDTFKDEVDIGIKSDDKFQFDFIKKDLQSVFKSYVKDDCVTNMIFRKNFSFIVENGEFYFDGISTVNPSAWELAKWNLSIEYNDIVIGTNIELLMDRNGFSDPCIVNKKKFEVII